MEEEKKETENAPAKTKELNLRFLGYVFFFLLALAGAAFLQMHAPVYWQRFLPFTAENADEAGKIAALEERLAKAEAKIEALAASGGAKIEAQAIQGSGAEDLEKLKTGLAGLSGALELLREQMQKSSATTDNVRQRAQSGFATIVAFTQMQNAALAGRPFEKERQALRELAGGDQSLIDDLLKLESAALTGAPETQNLRREWNELSGQAQAALRKSAATTWQDRILVALEGLVSIRSLNPKPGETLSFAAIDLDLAKGDLAAAVEKAAALPLEVKTVLADWLAKAERRRDMEQNLDALAAHLIAREIVKAPDGAAP